MFGHRRRGCWLGFAGTRPKASVWIRRLQTRSIDSSPFLAHSVSGPALSESGTITHPTPLVVEGSLADIFEPVRLLVHISGSNTVASRGLQSQTHLTVRIRGPLTWRCLPTSSVASRGYEPSAEIRTIPRSHRPGYRLGLLLRGSRVRPGPLQADQRPHRYQAASSRY